MLGGHNSFERRVQMIDRANRKAPKTRTNFVGPDGLVITRRRRSTPAVSPRGVLYLLCGFVLFKAIAVAQFSEAGYTERVEKLKAGTLIEQAGAVILQPDRFSVALGKNIAPFIR